MTRLYLLRHGEAKNNVKQIFGEDSELTEKGEEQARENARYLKDFDFDIIYHSPRKRAIKTANIIAETKSGLKLVEIEELVEMNYGKLEGLSIDEVNERFPGLFKERAENKYYWSGGGENFEDIRDRVRSFLNSLKSGPDSAIVAHQMTNRAILGELLDLPIDTIPFIAVPNDVIYKIELGSKNVWYIYKGVRSKGLVK